jgi:hypothetical protein
LAARRAPVVAFVLAFWSGACGGEDDKPRPLSGGQTVDVVASSSGGGGGGGEGGAGGGEGGSGGSAGPAPTCTQDVAFGATTIAFTFPTPEDLAVALDRVTYGYQDDPRPLSVVLFAAPERTAPKLVTSATRLDDETYSHVFPNSAQPTATGLVLTPGYLETESPQATGFLRVEDDNGRVDIELADVFMSASVSADCSTIMATVDAVIVAEESGTDLEIDGDDYTVGELAGDGGPSGWPFRAILQAEAVPFDFSSYEVEP